MIYYDYHRPTEDDDVVDLGCCGDMMIIFAIVGIFIFIGWFL